MGYLATKIGADGPVIDLTVWIGPARSATLHAAGRQVPGPATIRAPVDTGADRTAIDLEVIRGLGLIHHNQALLHSSAAGTRAIPADTYIAQLVLGGLQAAPFPGWREVQVVGVSVAKQGILALIGRDLLDSCLVVYDGRARTFALAYYACRRSSRVARRGAIRENRAAGDAWRLSRWRSPKP